MINYDSIISVFNEKGTLLKWLKKVEKALKESVLTNVEVLQGQGNSFAFKFTFQDNTSITTDYVTISPDITATLLHNYIEGSNTIVVDLNELQNKLIVKLDEEYKNTLATKSELASKQDIITDSADIVKQGTGLVFSNSAEAQIASMLADIEDNKTAIATKQNNIVDSEEIVKHTGEADKLYLNNNISNTINNSLQKPTTAPTATELVGIDANKAQVNIGGCDEFSLENNVLKLSDKMNINPNILINGDFKFNQRLMNAYYGPNVYGPDRWQIMDEVAGCASTYDNSWEVSIEDVTTAGSRYLIAQNIENYKALSDTDVTAHIEYKGLTEDVTGTTYLCIYDGVTETSQVLSSFNTSATVTAHIKSNPNQVKVYLKTGSTSLNMSMKVYYMKLEQGKNYTGKYCSNYETELARCQRFYQPVQVLGLTNIPNTTTTILVSANLITSLRTKPTASILFGSKMPSVTGNGATIACNGVTVHKYHTTSTILQFNLNTEATLLQLYTITTECNIALDSEIYFTLGNNRGGGIQ